MEEKHILTANGLVEFAKAALKDGWRYWYGTCGYRCTRELYEAKKEQYPAHYGFGRTARYMDDIAQGRMCTDCVGLIKAYCWDGVAVGRYAYHPDLSANGLFERAVIKGKIATLPERPGILVRYNGHVGIYVGNGRVIEARGFNYGVVETALSSRGWTHWYQDPYIDYADTAAQSGCDEYAALLDGKELIRRGARGEVVAALQRLLNALGHDCGEVDGIFGPRTDAAVMAFQRTAGIGVDGIVGSVTRGKMREALDTITTNGTLTSEHE